MTKCKFCGAEPRRDAHPVGKPTRPRWLCGTEGDIRVGPCYERQIAKLQAEIADADLLLGDSWQDVVDLARGEQGVEGALRSQIVKLSGDVATLQAENKRLRKELRRYRPEWAYDSDAEIKD